MWLCSGCALLGKPAATDGASAAPARAAAVQLEVQAPPALKGLLEQHLDLARLAQLPDDEPLADTEWARLVAAAPAQARELLQTEGYFEPQVTVSRESGVPQRVRVEVTLGARVRVAALNVDVQGELQGRMAAGEADARALDASLKSGGALRPGQPFRNPDWADTKQQLLARLRAAGYAGATLGSSQADIDVATHSARLRVLLDSGRLFHAGPLRVEGLVHHDLASVRNLAGFGAGAPLTETRLLDFQERLQKSGLFEAATVSFDPAAAAPADPAAVASAEVDVRLRELPLQQATVGVGYSANTGQRVSVEHTHRRPFDWPVIAHNKIEWGRDSQNWSSDFTSHPQEGFYRNLLGVQIERLRSATDIVLSQRLRLGRTQDTPRLERLYFAEWLRSRQSVLADGSAVDASALSANYHIGWRRLDSVLLPTRGISLSLQGGAGQAQSNTGQGGPFSRVYGRLTGYLPLGAQWYGQARVEAGQVIKRDSVVVPDALGFRAGGDDSVRGYGYRTLAPSAGGSVVSGNVLLTASAELARPLVASMPSVWGAVFIDAGRAAARWADYKPAFGYGVGVRWRSPIGPLRVDLAWGEELRKLRLHLSVGIVF